VGAQMINLDNVTVQITPAYSGADISVTAKISSSGRSKLPINFDPAVNIFELTPIQKAIWNFSGEVMALSGIDSLTWDIEEAITDFKNSSSKVQFEPECRALIEKIETLLANSKKIKSPFFDYPVVNT
jgi:hypothetical protein